MEVEKLKTMGKDLEYEIEECKGNLRKVGTLTIKIQSFVNMLTKTGNTSKEIELLKAKAIGFQKTIKELGEKKASQRCEFEQEMEDSKIRPQRITEVSQPNEIESNKDFYSKQSSKIDEFISTSMDTLESLKKQGRFIDNINRKLKQGLFTVGVSNDLVNKVESRFAGDRSLFYILITLLVIFILILRFVF